MARKLLALGVAAAALLMVSSVYDPADARQGGRSGGGGMGMRSGGGGPHVGARSYGGGSTVRSYNHAGQALRGHRGGHRFAHRFHRRHFVGVPLGVYGYYAYSDGCYWLRRNALETGSSYWWNRYNACISGYDYY